MQEFWALVTAFGDLRTWILALLLLGVYLSTVEPNLSKQTKRGLLAFVLTMILVSLATQALKVTVNEPRICVECPADSCNPYCPTDDPYAFPSGHTALSFAMVTIALLAFPRSGGRARWAWVFVLPVLVGASRVMLDVHTPMQVVAGAALGVAVAIAVWRVLRK